jgi:hypothetical protein
MPVDLPAGDRDRSEGNHDYLCSLGATPVTYREGPADRITAIAPEGVDAALDVSGRASLPEVPAGLGAGRE